jgi:Tol biopolymer transport system component
MDADGTNTRQVTKTGGINLFANWSRDGNKIFFVSLEGEDRGDFFTVDLGSMKRTRVTQTPYLNTAPSLLGF